MDCKWAGLTTLKKTCVTAAKCSGTIKAVENNGPLKAAVDTHVDTTCKPRRGLQIIDTRVNFPVPVQSRGRF